MRTPLLVAGLLCAAVPAFAQTTPPPAPETTVTEQAPPPEKKEPGKGDFDAGGQVRLPNGPDENNEYATFNWVAVDLKGRYFILDPLVQ